MADLKPHSVSVDRLQKDGALTWLHLSDIHFGGPDADGRPAILNRLLTDIETLKNGNNRLAPDLIFITGDIAWSGKAEQYKEKALPFLEELQQTTGVERNRIFLIPGNHDIDRSLVARRTMVRLQDDLLIEGAKENEKEISTFLYGAKDAEDRKDLLKKHSAYIDFVKEHFPHCAPLFDPCAYVAKVTVPDGLPFAKLWILGLNSAWLSREGEARDKLLLGYPQVLKALNFIETEKNPDEDFVFALTHHPLSWMADWDERLCKQQLGQRTDFHLSGHLHEHAFSLNAVGPQRYSSIAAGSVYGDGGMQWFNGYYFARLDFTTGKAHTFIRQYNPNRGVFVADTTFEKPNYGEFEWSLPIQWRQDNQTPPLGMKKVLFRYIFPINLSKDELALPENLLEQYREKLIAAIGMARFYGLPDRPLEKVFVELTVIEDFEILPESEYKDLMKKELRERRDFFSPNNISKAPSKPRRERRATRPEALLEAGRRFQVVGAPGCGKTTLLRWLALQATNMPDRLPIFIELKALKPKQFDTLEKSFSRFLFQQGIRKRFDDTDLTESQFISLEASFLEFYKAGRLVVLLDGLDEILESERHRLRAAIENYVNHHEGGVTLVVSTRPYGYLGNFADLKAMEIEPLSDRQIDKFLDHWYEKTTAKTVKANLRKTPNLWGLARIPFLLAFIAHLKSVGDFPRIELYQRIVQQLIVEIDKEKGIKRFKLKDPLGSIKREFLRKVAFEGLFEGNEQELSNRLVFTEDTLLEAAKEFVKQKGLRISTDNLVLDVCATPLLRVIGNKRYAFEQLTIQEFLAAEELSKRSKNQKLFVQAFFNRQLAAMEVLPMSIDQSNNPDFFYELLSNLPESFDFIRLCLEARSLGYLRKETEKRFYYQWQVRLTDFGLQKIRNESEFSSSVLSSFSGIEISHQPKIHSGFLIALGGRNRQERLCAIDSLGQLGHASHDIIRRLSFALGDGDKDVRQSAAGALGQLGQASPDAIAALAKALRDPEYWVRQNAADALVQLGHTTPQAVQALSDALNDQEPLTRLLAGETLIKLGYCLQEAVSVLTEGLKNENESMMRLVAAETLIKLGHDSHDAKRVLFDALSDDNWMVRQTALEVLGKIGHPLEDTAQAFFKALEDPAWPVRQSAAEAFGQLGLNSPKAVQALSVALCDRELEVSQSASESLVQLSYSSTDAVSALFDALKHDPEWKVRKNATQALGQLSPVLPDAVPALIKALQDRNKYVRQSAAIALSQSGNTSQATISNLSNALGDKEKIVVRSAAAALIQLDSASPKVIRTLSDALHDSEWQVRQHAAEAFGKLEATSLEVVVSLTNLLILDEDWGVRRVAAEALGKLGHRFPNSVTALVNALRDQNKYVRQSATKSLERIGFDSPVFCEGLKLLLTDPEPELQKMALRSIGYPSTDPGLLKDLEKLMGSDDPEISEAAKDAYEKYKFKLEMLGLLPA